MSKATVTKNDDGTIAVTLKQPVEHMGKVIKEVRLRSDIRVADLESMDKAKGDIERQIRLLAELSGLSMAVFRLLKPMDFAAIGEVAAELMGEDQATGES